MNIEEISSFDFNLKSRKTRIVTYVPSSDKKRWIIEKIERDR
jgi:hypothetical protein